MVLTPISWAQQILTLPFMTTLSPYQRYYEQVERQPKTMLGRALQMLSVLVMAAIQPSLYIDYPQSIIARFIPIIDVPIGRLVSHQGFFHSLFVMIVVLSLLGMTVLGFKRAIA